MDAYIKDIRFLLEQKNVCIPDYQRPYKWSLKNVNALIDDLFHFSSFPQYRLGTVVYHLDDDKMLNLVDGQQRSITIALIHLAIEELKQTGDHHGLDELKKASFKFPTFNSLELFKFKSPISKENIRTNFREIKRRVTDFDANTIRFFYDCCQVVHVTLNDISEAFQFFDSQNARGRDLSPHDLLKAYHLRELDSVLSEAEVNELVATWEHIDSGHLSNVFSHYLFRVRNWSKGKTAKYFSKSNVDEFKGVSPLINEPYPYTNLYRIGHHYVEGYNKEYHRKIDKQEMNFPFQLDQVVINGKRFFEMIHHYNLIIEGSKNLAKEKQVVKEGTVAAAILDKINSYDARHRTGDKYIRNLFDTALLYYIDKFGYADIERAIEKIFIWAYRLRLVRQSVQLASVDNHALAYPFVYKTIREAIKPLDFLNLSIPLIKESEYKESNKKDKLKDLVQIFQSLNYVLENE